ncbi:MAG: DNA-3-methyladenine glycosylase family protein [Clostridia bacterium]
MLSFIISQNNNIPRIKKCIDNLARTLGSPSGQFMGREFYDLPSPEVLAGATEEKLAPCRLGYRSKYLIETARQVAEAGLDSLERLGAPEVTSQEAFEALNGYCGVGPKVANCIALFSMGKLDRFPIDVGAGHAQVIRYRRSRYEGMAGSQSRLSRNTEASPGSIFLLHNSL